MMVKPPTRGVSFELNFLISSYSLTLFPELSQSAAATEGNKSSQQTLHYAPAVVRSFDPQECRPVSGTIRGKIIEVTAQGDLVTDLLAEQMEGVGRGADTKVTVDNDHETIGIFGSEHGQPAMTLVAILEPPGALRLHLVSDSAAMMLGVRVGAVVEVSR